MLRMALGLVQCYSVCLGTVPRCAMVQTEGSCVRTLLLNATVEWRGPFRGHLVVKRGQCLYQEWDQLNRQSRLSQIKKPSYIFCLACVSLPDLRGSHQMRLPDLWLPEPLAFK